MAAQELLNRHVKNLVNMVSEDELDLNDLFNILDEKASLLNHEPRVYAVGETVWQFRETDTEFLFHCEQYPGEYLPEVTSHGVCGYYSVFSMPYYSPMTQDDWNGHDAFQCFVETFYASTDASTMYDKDARVSVAKCMLRYLKFTEKTDSRFAGLLKLLEDYSQDAGYETIASDLATRNIGINPTTRKIAAFDGFIILCD